jgi:hypothetical protein
MRVIEKKTVTGTTAYSPVFTAPPMATYMALSCQRTAGSASTAVTIEGGWSSTSSTAADWVDIGFAATLANGNLTIATGGAYNAQRTNFAYYRVKIVASSSVTVDAYVQFVHH